jgi:hypothetical protein
MDGVLMSAPFSSLPVPGLRWRTQVDIFFFLSSAQVGFFLGNVFFLTPHACPGLTYLLTFRLLAYAPWPPPSPTTYLPMCLHTKSPPRQR